MGAGSGGCVGEGSVGYVGAGCGEGSVGYVGMRVHA